MKYDPIDLETLMAEAELESAPPWWAIPALILCFLAGSWGAVEGERLEGEHIGAGIERRN